jgi:hypothetical protein
MPPLNTESNLEMRRKEYPTFSFYDLFESWLNFSVQLVGVIFSKECGFMGNFLKKQEFYSKK